MPVLVDTNILIRAIQRNHPQMRAARKAMRTLVESGEELCVTSQILAEFWNVCTRPSEVNGLGISIGATDRLMSRVERFFRILPDSPEVFRQWRRLIVVHEIRGAKVHDARIAAAMRVAGIRQVLTFNGADFRRFPDVAVLHPADL